LCKEHITQQQSASQKQTHRQSNFTIAPTWSGNACSQKLTGKGKALLFQRLKALASKIMCVLPAFFGMFGQARVATLHWTVMIPYPALSGPALLRDH
jgi:hypothetical protein